MLNKELIIHDHFEIYGGAEKNIFFIAQNLKLRIFTFYRNKGIQSKIKYFSNCFFSLSIKLHPIIRSAICFIFYSFYNFNFNKYKKIYLSGHFSILLLRPKINANIVYLCHSPPRFMTDQKDQYKKKYKIWYNILFLNFFINLYKRKYKSKLAYCDQIICNSNISKNRLSKFIKKKNIKVLYPLAFNVQKYKNKKKKEYYLSLSRLHWTKRVIDVVKIFKDKKFKDKKLIICSDGPEKQNILKLIQKNNFKNIKYLGYVTEKQKIDLLSKCIAVIHIPVDEEFGFVNLETLASGKMLITTDEGEFGNILKKNKNNMVIKNYTLFKLKSELLKLDIKRLNFQKISQENIKLSRKFGKKNYFNDLLKLSNKKI